MSIQGFNGLPPINAAQNDLRVWLRDLGTGKKSFQTASAAQLMIGQRLLNNAQRSSVANLNVNFASSRSQTVDSYLQNTNDAMGRLKELSVKAADGMLTDTDREAINAEAQEILKQVDQNYQTANFNGQKILQGGTENVAVTSDGDSIEVHNGNISRQTLGLEDFDLSTQEGATAALGSVDGAIENLGEQRALIGTDQRVLEERYDANLEYETSLMEAGSKQADLDYAMAATEHASASVRSQVAVAVSAQGNQLHGSMLAGLF